MNTAAKTRQTQRDHERIAWWEEARFGMFIHWGLYAIPAGKWKGKAIEGIGEWIMRRAEIPASEYEQLASQFNPVKFDADAIAKLAQDAGMKYLVITAKHHDGFAMYDSPCSDYDIVDATPYGKDIMAALAKACQKYGIRLCFYYSQDQDWHDPNASGNAWDFDPATKDFASYLENKVKPQVRELLTQYGPIGLIWFDTPVSISLDQSQSLSRLVHTLQPDCLVSGRVGNGVGDYGSLGDNQIPTGRLKGYWETPATLNDTWGYKTDDHNWKSVKTLLHLLVDLASKGVNYLLNIGPRADGSVPDESVNRLRAIGEWMKTNGEAIYGAKATPYPHEFPWGGITQKGNRLYLLFTHWPGERFALPGLHNRVQKATLLADERAHLEVSQTRDNDCDMLELRLPECPDPNVAVVALDLDGTPEVDQTAIQQADGSITMIASMVNLHVPKSEPQIYIGESGVIENWFSTSNWIDCEFKVSHPGAFEIRIHTSALRRAREWMGGHEVRVDISGHSFRKTITPDAWSDSPKARYFPEAATVIGDVQLDTPGVYTIEVRAESINKKSRAGLSLSAITLTRKEVRA